MLWDLSFKIPTGICKLIETNPKKKTIGWLCLHHWPELVILAWIGRIQGCFEGIRSAREPVPDCDCCKTWTTSLHQATNLSTIPQKMCIPFNTCIFGRHSHYCISYVLSTFYSLCIKYQLLPLAWTFIPNTNTKSARSSNISSISVLQLLAPYARKPTRVFRSL